MDETDCFWFTKPWLPCKNFDGKKSVGDHEICKIRVIYAYFNENENPVEIGNLCL